MTDGSVTTTVELDNQVLLPSFYTYRGLHWEFQRLNSRVSISHSGFQQFWKGSEEFKSIKIRLPTKDICNYYTILKAKLQPSKSQRTLDGEQLLASEEWSEAKQKLTEHRNEYRQCCDFYEATIFQSTQYP